MIDLSRKDSCYPGEKDLPARVCYPSLHITSEDAIKFPDGKFEATISCKCKAGEWRENERGERVCAYTLEVFGIQPGKSVKGEDGEGEEGEEQDAASAIMESMQKTASKKLKDE